MIWMTKPQKFSFCAVSLSSCPFYVVWLRFLSTRCCVYEPVKGAKQPAKIPHMVPTNLLATFAFLHLLFKAA